MDREEPRYLYVSPNGAAPSRAEIPGQQQAILVAAAGQPAATAGTYQGQTVTWDPQQLQAAQLAAAAAAQQQQNNAAAQQYYAQQQYYAAYMRNPEYMQQVQQAQVAAAQQQYLAHQQAEQQARQLALAGYRTAPAGSNTQPAYRPGNGYEPNQQPRPPPNM